MIRTALRALAVTVGLAGTCAFAQVSAPSVSARLSTGVARLGSDVVLVVEVEGAQQASIGALPAVDGLAFGPVGNPSAAYFEQIVGRRVTRTVKQTWTIAVRPTRKGDFTIPPIAVTAEGKSLATSELTLRVVEDLAGEELGYFTIEAPKQVIEGQPFTIDLRFGYDTALGELTQDINYLDLSLPWLGQLPGILEIESSEVVNGSARVDGIGINSRGTTSAERIAPIAVDKRTFHVLRIRKRYLATRAGTLEFGTSHLEFGHVDNNIFNLRPTEKRSYYKRVPAFSIEVIRLPEEDRPIDYTGAVGKIAAAANADTRFVDAGDSIKLSVEWTGEGNLEFFDPPDLGHMEAFSGFRLFGTNDSHKTPGRRVVVYDLAPISTQARSIPAVPLRVFDPETRKYTTVSTKPIPISVRALAKGASLPDGASPAEPVLDIRDIQTASEAGGDARHPGGGALLATLLLIPVLWSGGRTLVRRRGDPQAPRVRARRAARKVLARELAKATKASEQGRALCRFLAARTGEPEQAWVGRNPVAWAAGAAGTGRLDADDARALAERMRELDERAWAGGDGPIDAGTLLETADRLIRGGL